MYVKYLSQSINVFCRTTGYKKGTQFYKFNNFTIALEAIALDVGIYKLMNEVKKVYILMLSNTNKKTSSFT